MAGKRKNRRKHHIEPEPSTDDELAEMTQRLSEMNLEPPEMAWGLPEMTFGPPEMTWGPPGMAWGASGMAWGAPGLTWGAPSMTWGPFGITWGIPAITWVVPGMIFGVPAMGLLHPKVTTRRPPMKIIVAMDTSLGIGKNGTVPWNLSGIRYRFRRLTTTTRDPNKQNAVLMGRRVWENIPEDRRPLDNRLNVVLSTTMAEPEDGSYLVARSFQGALDMLNAMSDRIETIWNIGGYRLFEEGLNCPQLYQMALTFIDGDFEADVTFPYVHMERFFKLENGEDSHIIAENGYRYRFETFQSLLYEG